MKIWKEYNSSHSDNVTIVGTFADADKANNALEIIKDVALCSWEERFANVKEFAEKWKERFSSLEYEFSDMELQSGIDNEPDIEVEDNTITISRYRSGNIGAIVKMMLKTGATGIQVEQ